MNENITVFDNTPRTVAAIQTALARLANDALVTASVENMFRAIADYEMADYCANAVERLRLAYRLLYLAMQMAVISNL